MKITYRLTNFKAFQDTGVIDLAPITVLCGANSVGKSSILKSLLLLRQSTAERRSRLAQNAPTQPLLFNGELTRLGSWTDAVFGKSRTSKIGMSWSAKGNLNEIPSNRNFHFRNRTRLQQSTKNSFDFGLDVELRSNFSQTEELSTVLSKISVRTDDLNVIFYEQDEFSSSYNGIYIASVNNISKLLSGLPIHVFYGLDAAKEIFDVLKNSIFNITSGSLFLLLEGPFPISTTPKLDVSWLVFFETVLEAITKSRIGTRGPRPGWLVNFEHTLLAFRKQMEAQADYEVENLQQDVLHSLARLFCLGLDFTISFCLLGFSPVWKQLRYLGPLRSQPQRFYQFDDTGGVDIGVSGEFTVQVLALEANNIITVSSIETNSDGRISISPQSKKSLLEATNEWLEIMGLPAVHPAVLRQSLYELRVGKIDVALPDVGFGVSQVLPIVVEALRCGRGDTIILEQPEIHLHPKVQAALADFFIARSKDGVKFIIESHSEYLIKRLCRRISEDTVKNVNELVNIVFIEKTMEQDVHCQKIDVNEYGEIRNWPSGFFDNQEDMYWTAAALKRRRELKEASV